METQTITLYIPKLGAAFSLNGVELDTIGAQTFLYKFSGKILELCCSDDGTFELKEMGSSESNGPLVQGFAIKNTDSTYTLHSGQIYCQLPAPKDFLNRAGLSVFMPDAPEGFFVTITEAGLQLPVIADKVFGDIVAKNAWTVITVWREQEAADKPFVWRWKPELTPSPKVKSVNNSAEPFDELTRKILLPLNVEKKTGLDKDELWDAFRFVEVSGQTVTDTHKQFTWYGTIKGTLVITSPAGDTAPLALNSLCVSVKNNAGTMLVSEGEHKTPGTFDSKTQLSWEITAGVSKSMVWPTEGARVTCVPELHFMPKPEDEPAPSVQKAAAWLRLEDGWIQLAPAHIDGCSWARVSYRESREVCLIHGVANDPDTSVDLLLDTSGSKWIKLTRQRVTIVVENPAIRYVHANCVRWITSDMVKNPNYPPLDDGVLDSVAFVPIQAGLLPEGESAPVSATLHLIDQQLQITFIQENQRSGVYWRPPVKLRLDTPESWAVNDDHAALAPSSLRGLLPFSFKSICLECLPGRWKCVNALSEKNGKTLALMDLPSRPFWSLHEESLGLEIDPDTMTYRYRYAVGVLDEQYRTLPQELLPAGGTQKEAESAEIRKAPLEMTNVINRFNGKQTKFIDWDTLYEVANKKEPQAGYEATNLNWNNPVKFPIYLGDQKLDMFLILEEVKTKEGSVIRRWSFVSGSYAIVHAVFDLVPLSFIGNKLTVSTSMITGFDELPGTLTLDLTRKCANGIEFFQLNPDLKGQIHIPWKHFVAEDAANDSIKTVIIEDPKLFFESGKVKMKLSSLKLTYGGDPARYAISINKGSDYILLTQIGGKLELSYLPNVITISGDTKLCCDKTDSLNRPWEIYLDHHLPGLVLREWLTHSDAHETFEVCASDPTLDDKITHVIKTVEVTTIGSRVFISGAPQEAYRDNTAILDETTDMKVKTLTRIFLELGRSASGCLEPVRGLIGWESSNLLGLGTVESSVLRIALPQVTLVWSEGNRDPVLVLNGIWNWQQKVTLEMSGEQHDGRCIVNLLFSDGEIPLSNGKLSNTSVPAIVHVVIKQVKDNKEEALIDFTGETMLCVSNGSLSCSSLFALAHYVSTGGTDVPAVASWATRRNCFSYRWVTCPRDVSASQLVACNLNFSTQSLPVNRIIFNKEQLITSLILHPPKLLLPELSTNKPVPYDPCLPAGVMFTVWGKFPDEKKLLAEYEEHTFAATRLISGDLQEWHTSSVVSITHTLIDLATRPSARVLILDDQKLRTLCTFDILDEELLKKKLTTDKEKAAPAGTPGFPVKPPEIPGSSMDMEEMRKLAEEMRKFKEELAKKIDDYPLIDESILLKLAQNALVNAGWLREAVLEISYLRLAPKPSDDKPHSDITDSSNPSDISSDDPIEPQRQLFVKWLLIDSPKLNRSISLDWLYKQEPGVTEAALQEPWTAQMWETISDEDNASFSIAADQESWFAQERQNESGGYSPVEINLTLQATRVAPENRVAIEVKRDIPFEHFRQQPGSKTANSPDWIILSDEAQSQRPGKMWIDSFPDSEKKPPFVPKNALLSTISPRPGELVDMAVSLVSMRRLADRAEYRFSNGLCSRIRSLRARNGRERIAISVAPKKTEVPGRLETEVTWERTHHVKHELTESNIVMTVCAPNAMLLPFETVIPIDLWMRVDQLHPGIQQTLETKLNEVLNGASGSVARIVLELWTEEKRESKANLFVTVGGTSKEFEFDLNQLQVEKKRIWISLQSFGEPLNAAETVRHFGFQIKVATDQKPTPLNLKVRILASIVPAGDFLCGSIPEEYVSKTAIDQSLKDIVFHANAIAADERNCLIGIVREETLAGYGREQSSLWSPKAQHNESGLADAVIWTKKGSFTDIYRADDIAPRTYHVFVIDSDGSYSSCRGES